MAFPKRLFGTPLGWEDRGETGEKRTKTGVSTWMHTICRHRTHIGRENSGRVFEFCPVCLIEITGINLHDSVPDGGNISDADDTL